MAQKESSIQTRVKAPRAAAIAGTLSLLLLIISFVLILGAIPDNAREGRTLFSTYGKTLLMALNLVSFAGIAFLWFVGVVRDRLGSLEDPFISTVFLGSGLLFLAMLFVLTAIEGRVIILASSQPKPLFSADFYRLALTVARQILNTYALKTAGVFMFSTRTLFIHTRVIPRWMAFLGYALAAVMVLRISHLDRLGWISLSFPLWMLLVSLYILIDNFRQKTKAAPL